MSSRLCRLLAATCFAVACTDVTIQQQAATGGAGGVAGGQGGGGSGGAAGNAAGGGGTGQSGGNAGQASGGADAAADVGPEGDGSPDADAAPPKWWTDKVDGCDQKAGIVCCPHTTTVLPGFNLTQCGVSNKAWDGWTHWGPKCSVNPAGGIEPMLPVGTKCYPFTGQPTPADWCCEP